MLLLLLLYAQGPHLNDNSSDDDTPGGSKEGKRRSPSRPTISSSSSNGSKSGSEDAAAGSARWHAPLGDDGCPGDLAGLVKVDMPHKSNAGSCYLLRWPGGWKLQSGTITKFHAVTKPPVLLVSRAAGAARAGKCGGQGLQQDSSVRSDWFLFLRVFLRVLTSCTGSQHSVRAMLGWRGCPRCSTVLCGECFHASVQ